MLAIKNFIYPCKNDILDPLTVIIKLFLCSYKPTGTKLSIGNNKLIIQEKTVVQGPIRMIFGDTKNDLNILQYPIIFACQRYLCDEKKDKFLIIFERVMLSIDKLRDTYNGNEILYSIDLIKNIIESFIKNNNFNPLTLINNYDSPANKIKQNIYSHIDTIWQDYRLNILFGFIQEINNAKSDDLLNMLLYSLANYIECIDNISQTMINHL